MVCSTERPDRGTREATTYGNPERRPILTRGEPDVLHDRHHGIFGSLLLPIARQRRTSVSFGADTDGSGRGDRHLPLLQDCRELARRLHARGRGLRCLRSGIQRRLSLCGLAPDGAATGDRTRSGAGPRQGGDPFSFDPAGNGRSRHGPTGVPRRGCGKHGYPGEVAESTGTPTRLRKARVPGSSSGSSR